MFDIDHWSKILRFHFICLIFTCSFEVFSSEDTKKEKKSNANELWKKPFILLKILTTTEPDLKTEF